MRFQNLTRQQLSTQDPSTENDVAAVQFHSHKDWPSPIVQQLNSSNKFCVQIPGMNNDVSKKEQV